MPYQYHPNAFLLGPTSVVDCNGWLANHFLSLVGWIGAVVARLREPNVALWCAVGASVLGLHTIVLTDWQSLFELQTTSEYVCPRRRHTPLRTC